MISIRLFLLGYLVLNLAALISRTNTLDNRAQTAADDLKKRYKKRWDQVAFRQERKHSQTATDNKARRDINIAHAGARLVHDHRRHFASPKLIYNEGAHLHRYQIHNRRRRDAPGAVGFPNLAGPAQLPMSIEGPGSHQDASSSQSQEIVKNKLHLKMQVKLKFPTTTASSTEDPEAAANKPYVVVEEMNQEHLLGDSGSRSSSSHEIYHDSAFMHSGSMSDDDIVQTAMRVVNKTKTNKGFIRRRNTGHSSPIRKRSIVSDDVRRRRRSKLRTRRSHELYQDALDLKSMDSHDSLIYEAEGSYSHQPQPYMYRVQVIRFNTTNSTNNATTEPPPMPITAPEAKLSQALPGPTPASGGNRRFRFKVRQSKNRRRRKPSGWRKSRKADRKRAPEPTNAQPSPQAPSGATPAAVSANRQRRQNRHVQRQPRVWRDYEADRVRRSFDDTDRLLARVRRKDRINKVLASETASETLESTSHEKIRARVHQKVRESIETKTIESKDTDEDLVLIGAKFSKMKLAAGNASTLPPPPPNLLFIHHSHEWNEGHSVARHSMHSLEPHSERRKKHRRVKREAGRNQEERINFRRKRSPIIIDDTDNLPTLSPHIAKIAPMNPPVIIVNGPHATATPSKPCICIIQPETEWSRHVNKQAKISAEQDLTVLNRLNSKLFGRVQSVNVQTPSPITDDDCSCGEENHAVTTQYPPQTSKNGPPPDHDVLQLKQIASAKAAAAAARRRHRRSAKRDDGEQRRQRSISHGSLSGYHGISSGSHDFSRYSGSGTYSGTGSGSSSESFEIASHASHESRLVEVSDRSRSYGSRSHPHDDVVMFDIAEGQRGTIVAPTAAPQPEHRVFYAFRQHGFKRVEHPAHVDHVVHQESDSGSHHHGLMKRHHDGGHHRVEKSKGNVIKKRDVLHLKEIRKRRSAPPPPPNGLNQIDSLMMGTDSESIADLKQVDDLTDLFTEMDAAQRQNQNPGTLS